eukprot:703577-Prymnesium_polylepis.1
MNGHISPPERPNACKYVYKTVPSLSAFSARVIGAVTKYGTSHSFEFAVIGCVWTASGIRGIYVFSFENNHTSWTMGGYPA